MSVAHRSIISVLYPKPEVTEKASLRNSSPLALLQNRIEDNGRNTYGGMREMSVLEPPPGEVGFFKVVSMSVQPSPLSPQPPSNSRRRH